MAGTSAYGMGFGRVASGTLLGQPLNFTSVVNLEGDESLTRECVFAEVIAGDIRIAPGFVRVALENGSNERERVVRVSTSTPIDEPVVAINVSLGCASRTTRRFVEFVDPPGVTLAQAAPAAAEPVAASARNDAVTSSSIGVAPAQTERPGGSVSTDRADGPVTASRGAGVVAAAPSGAPRLPAPSSNRQVAAAQRKPPIVRQAAATTRAAPGARLQLDAPSVAVVAGPAASSPPAPAPAVADATVAAASVPASAAAAEAETQAALLEQERRRVRSLEEAVARLQADAQVQRQALAALQVRTRGTRSERYANPFVYTLAALCLLLTMIICGLLGRRSRDRAAARWLTGPLPGKADANEVTAVPAENGPVAPPVLLSEPASSELLATPSSLPAQAMGPVEVLPDASRAAPARREGVEEHAVDLEQQADFFVVLGQDDAAIELLRDHADAGPLPLLKLMEIHRRLGDRAEYEKVRNRVVRHFNADAPKWQADPGCERSLEEYPEVLARIESLWATPAAAMQALDVLMFRRGADDVSFDLPAYRELMLLHSIARDREAGEASAVPAAPRAVDLFLPIGPAAPHAPIARLTATVGAPPRSTVPVPAAPARLRVPIPALPARAGGIVESHETIPSALRRAPGYANESAFVDLELEFPGLPTAPRTS